jgi:glycosyltransferase involved in cell wall biosynthesis
MNLFGPFIQVGRYSGMAERLKAGVMAPSMAVPVLRLAQLIEREETTLIHANGLKASILTCFLAPLVRAPILWHVHDFLRARRFHELFVLLGEIVPDAVLVNSHAVAEDFFGNRKVIVVHNGVDLSRFSPAEKSSSDDPSLKVGMIGALAPWKGQHLFIQAAKQVSERVGNVKFLIVGDEIYDTSGHRGYKEELQRLAGSLGIESQVVFTGFQHDVARVIGSLDLVVHCSLEPEPFGRVIVEAMACGQPVIAAKAGGVLEIIEDGVTGILVAPGDVSSLADAMCSLLGNEAKRDAIGQAARKRMERSFTLEDQVKRVESLYESLLK